jgi:hypothetical protein
VRLVSFVNTTKLENIITFLPDTSVYILILSPYLTQLSLVYDELTKVKTFLRDGDKLLDVVTAYVYYPKID